MVKKSKVYVIEGVDGCGKTTICRELSSRNGWKYLSTPMGLFKERVNEIEKLNDKPLSLSYFLSAVLNTSCSIRTKIADHKTVICDRYYPTLKVYFTAINFSQNFVNMNNLPLVKPDKIIHLYVDYQKIKERLFKENNLSLGEIEIIRNRKFYNRLISGYRKECDFEINATDLSVNEIVKKLSAVLV